MQRRRGWPDGSTTDLDAIADYIALDNERAARALVKKVFARVERLPGFPDMGRVPPELPDMPEYRELIIGPCRVFYRVADDRILIVHVMRQERLFDVERLLVADPDEDEDAESTEAD
jgi:toxin ParE1/3/4